MIKRRLRKSVEQWKAVIADQQASCLSRVDYCLKHDIHIDTFSARLSDINRGLDDRSNQTSNSIDKSQLVQVTKAPRNKQREFIAIAFADVEVRLPMTVEPRLQIAFITYGLSI